MNEQITPDKALEIVDNALQQLQANRQSHFVLQQCMEVLRQAITTEQEQGQETKH